MSTKRSGALFLAILPLFMPGSLRADLFVTGVITPQAGSYHYEFSVENTGPEDVSIVSIWDAPVGDPLIEPSLTSPAGYVASYDGGLGFVDLVEDASPFSAGTLVTGFSFDSLAAAGTAFTQFEALNTNGDPILGRVNLVVVPEPLGAFLWMGLGLAGAALIRRCREGSQPQ